MKFELPGLSINPFEKDVVHKPRECPTSVATLNEDILASLIAAFDAVNDKRTSVGNKAELILSVAPGYGKSHLIGRLFKALDRKATQIFLTPFQTVSLCWQSILLHLVNELDYPESSDETRWTIDEPRQLEALVEGVLKNLIANAIDEGLVRIVQGGLQSEELRKSSEISIGKGADPRSTWLRDHFVEELFPLCQQQLYQLRLTSAAWLKVLFYYLTSPQVSEIRQGCLAWLRYEPLDDSIILSLGIGPGENPRSEPVDVVNNACWLRIHDFCKLARYYRPFLFCFDQTEDYKTNRELVEQFGRVVVRMVNEVPNQLTVVTANQQIWDKQILPNIDDAHRDRFSVSKELRGLKFPEAEELIRLRLAPFALPEELLDRFLDQKWLKALFSERKAIPAREFMQQCRDRWAGAKTATPVAPLEQIFEEYLSEFRVNPRWRYFDPDVFRWLAKGPLAADPAIVCVENKKETPFAELQWSVQGRAEILFGFVRELHFTQWKKIADVADAWRARHPGKVAKMIYFRSEDLSPVPKPTWTKTGPAIRAALGPGLLVLSKEESAELNAARDLYLEAVSGNVSGYSGEDVLQFLQKRLASWRKRILQSPSPSNLAEPERQSPTKSPDQSFIEKLRTLLQQEKFLSLTDALERLGPGTSEDFLLEACEKIPQIQKIAHPNMVVLIWQG
ncbi:MAG TPA: hypothetical protein VE860_25760 [Chthoniobacterales bacterium]|nr:hypothetical protein [Chthoniobacterales bacterium]